MKQIQKYAHDKNRALDERTWSKMEDVLMSGRGTPLSLVNTGGRGGGFMPQYEADTSVKWTFRSLIPSLVIFLGRGPLGI